MVQGSQAPGSCFRGGEAEEEKEAGYKVSGPTLEPPKARLMGTWWALHSRRPRGTTHGDTPHIPWPRPLPRPPDGLLRALGWMRKTPHAPGRVPGQVSHTPPSDHSLPLPRPALLSRRDAAACPDKPCQSVDGRARAGEERGGR